MKLGEAALLGGKFMVEIQSMCENVCLAGSVRRLKAEVHDVEIVCKPRLYLNPNVFEQGYPLLEFLKHPNTPFIQKECQRLSGQNRAQKWQLPGIKLDLFIVLPPAQWGVIFLLRTGSAVFSHKMVSQKRIGGYLPNKARVKDGCVWVEGQAIMMPEEKDFFDFVGMRYLSPSDRGM